MLQLKPQNIIPITAARGQLDDIVSAAKGSNYFVISRQGRPETAMVDWEYLIELQRRVEADDAWKAVEGLRTGFKEYLIKNGYNPNKLTDKQAETLLQKFGNE